MKIRELDPIGVEVTEVNVAALDDRAFRDLYQAWLDFNVVVVRDQNLSIPEYLAYSRRFGAVSPHPSKSTRHPEFPEITMLGANKFKTDGSLDNEIYRRGAEGFHTDGSYDQIPFVATQLYAVAIPSRGGDTLFFSAYDLHDQIPERLRTYLEGKYAAYKYGGQRQANELLNQEDRNAVPVRHAIIQQHPETGRKLVYFDPNKVLNIVGVRAAESDDVMRELSAYYKVPSAIYRHQWKKGDTVIWDNRCSYHRAAGDYPPEEERIHWRVSVHAAQH